MAKQSSASMKGTKVLKRPSTDASKKRNYAHPASVRGVLWSEHRQYWHVYWYVGGKQFHKYFGMGTYRLPGMSFEEGKQKAMEAAIAFRRDMETMCDSPKRGSFAPASSSQSSMKKGFGKAGAKATSSGHPKGRSPQSAMKSGLRKGDAKAASSGPPKGRSSQPSMKRQATSREPPVGRSSQSSMTSSLGKRGAKATSSGPPAKRTVGKACANTSVTAHAPTKKSGVPGVTWVAKRHVWQVHCCAYGWRQCHTFPVHKFREPGMTQLQANRAALQAAIAFRRSKEASGEARVMGGGALEGRRSTFSQGASSNTPKFNKPTIARRPAACGGCSKPTLARRPASNYGYPKATAARRVPLQPIREMERAREKGEAAGATQDRSVAGGEIKTEPAVKAESKVKVETADRH